MPLGIVWLSPSLNRLLHALSGSEARSELVTLRRDGLAIEIPVPAGENNQLSLLLELHLNPSSIPGRMFAALAS